MTFTYTVRTESDETAARLEALAAAGGCATVEDWLNGLVQTYLRSSFVQEQQASADAILQQAAVDADVLAATVVAGAAPGGG